MSIRTLAPDVFVVGPVVVNLVETVDDVTKDRVQDYEVACNACVDPSFMSTRLTLDEAIEEAGSHYLASHGRTP